MRKLGVVLLLILFSLFILTGCWNRREVEDLAIVAAMGFDFVEIDGLPKYRITVQVIRPQSVGSKKQGGGGGGGGSPVWIESSIGNTLNEAIRNFNTRSSRQLFLAHTKIIVIGENAAKRGLHELIDFIQRQKELRLRTWIVITKKDSLELLKIKPTLETLPSTELVGMFTNNQPNVSKAAVSDLKNFLDDLASSGCDPVASVFEIDPFGPQEDAQDEQTSSGPAEFVRLHGTAVFRADKLVGYLEDEETMGLLWIRGQMKRSVITLVDQDKKIGVSIENSEGSSELIPELNGNDITMRIKIKAAGDLGEHMGTHAVLSELSKFERKYAEKIKDQVHDVVMRVQSEQYRADILDFGDTIHRKYPEKWRQLEKDWSTKHFPKVKVKVEVEAKIRHTGMISDSIPIK